MFLMLWDICHLFQTETIQIPLLAVHLHPLTDSYMYISFIHMNLLFWKPFPVKELRDELVNAAYIPQGGKSKFCCLEVL